MFNVQRSIIKVWKATMLVVLFMLHGSLFTAMAQQMQITDFSRVKRPLWKQSKAAVDKQQAIIDLATTEKGFTFTANGKQAAEAEEGEGIITVKVPDKTRYLTISHGQYGQLTWRVPTKYLKRKKHYRATLLANDPTKAYKAQQQWVTITTDPANTIVTIDSTTTLVNDGQYTALLPVGKHDWHVESPFYEEQADSFLLTDTARVSLSIKLQPAYAYVTVSTPWELGDIYIDGFYTARGSGSSRRLQEGKHRLSVFRYDMCIYDGTFTIGSAEKKHITLTARNFSPQPLRRPDNRQAQPTAVAATTGTLTASARVPNDTNVVAPVELKAPDADTEIWVDREYVGKGQWSGQLTQGYHIVSTRKDSVESKTTSLWILDMTARQLDLSVPEVSKGMLNIYSNVTGADIYINEARMATTPAIIQELPADRQYTVRVHKDGYRDVKAVVTPKGNTMTDVKLKMKKK